jgi:hypothetical protein
MADSKDPEVTRRETLRLATAVGALGAGLGITLATGGALALPAVQAKWAPTKATLTPKDLGAVSLKIERVSPGASPEVLYAVDLTPHFLKLDASKGEALSFKIENMKENAATTLLDHTVAVSAKGV